MATRQIRKLKIYNPIAFVELIFLKKKNQHEDMKEVIEGRGLRDGEWLGQKIEDLQLINFCEDYF